MSELASADLSPSRGIAIAQKRNSHQKHHNPEQYEHDEQFAHEVFNRNITQLCSSLDLSTVYDPPSSLLLPGDASKQRKTSVSGSGSGSDSESSISSGDEGNSRRRESRESRKSSGTIPASETVLQDIAQTETVPQAIPHTTSKEPVVRQGSFGSGTSSILGHIASHAKELVKETKRQSSQEGLLSQVDKV